MDVTGLNTRIQLFGREFPFPILLAPTGGHRRSHPEGELATARGAGQAGAAMVVSSNANTAIEEIAAVSTAPLWFQAYILRDRGFTRDLVQRVEDAGCQAICVTLDSTIQGPRNRQARTARLGYPPGTSARPNLQGQKPIEKPEHRLLGRTKDPTATWKDIGWLRSFARVPVLLKGIMDAEDAEQGLEQGVDGIIVSNHGARNVDTAPATIDVLPEIVEQIEGRVPVLMDGGVRRGTDVLKALALGANAVFIGRPYIYGLAAAGSEGVRRVLGILHRELATAMVLTGRPTIGSIDRNVLWSPRA